MTFGQQIPDTRFATVGDDRIAYQVFGEGDVDLIFVPSLGDCMDMRWQWPSYVYFLRHLGAHARVIMFDLRGSGASDASSAESLPNWERWADETRAVLDEADSEQAVLFGFSHAGPTAILFAASHPSRTRGLILANTTARYGAGPGYQGGISDETARFVRNVWGTEAMVELANPDAAADPAFRRWNASSQRLSLSPRDASRIHAFESSLDVRETLPLLQMPTLVLHREGYKLIPIEHAEYLAEHIPGARLALVPGNDAALYVEPMSETLRQMEDFLGGSHSLPNPDRALAAILFTDIVSSTELASAMGDRRWCSLLERHDSLATAVVDQYGGSLVHASGGMGDGILATFDGPGRAIHCARALADSLRSLGVSIRCGIHTGEVEVRDSGLAGIGAHIAARVVSAAGPDEILVSGAVPMLMAGSGVEFEDRGEQELRGVPGTWRLFTVVK